MYGLGRIDKNLINGHKNPKSMFANRVSEFKSGLWENDYLLATIDHADPTCCSLYRTAALRWVVAVLLLCLSSLDLLKLFATKISSNTIKQRAQRQKKKKGTNVPNNAITQDDKKSTKSNAKKKDLKKDSAKDGTARGGKRKGAGRKKIITFNEAKNDNIKWAKWTWNPVTGCKHGCKYCYARDIANRFNKEKFEPTFHPNRLVAPKNTKIPQNKHEALYL